MPPPTTALHPGLLPDPAPTAKAIAADRPAPRAGHGNPPQWAAPEHIGQPAQRHQEQSNPGAAGRRPAQRLLLRSAQDCAILWTMKQTSPRTNPRPSTRPKAGDGNETGSRDTRPRIPPGHPNSEPGPDQQRHPGGFGCAGPVPIPCRRPKATMLWADQNGLMNRRPVSVPGSPDRYDIC